MANKNAFKSLETLITARLKGVKEKIKRQYVKTTHCLLKIYDKGENDEHF